MEQPIKKPKYLIYAEQAHKRKEEKYKEVFESAEYTTYLENRKKWGLPDLPAKELYSKFLRARREKRYREKIQN